MHYFSALFNFSNKIIIQSQTCSAYLHSSVWSLDEVIGRNIKITLEYLYFPSPIITCEAIALTSLLTSYFYSPMTRPKWWQYKQRKWNDNVIRHSQIQFKTLFGSLERFLMQEYYCNLTSFFNHGYMFIAFQNDWYEIDRHISQESSFQQFCFAFM